MASSLYSSISTRQPCAASTSRCGGVLSRQHAITVAAPLNVPSGMMLHVSSQHRQHHHSMQQRLHAVGGGSRHQQQHHDIFDDHQQQPLHQHQQHIQPPEWHPRLFGLKDSKRAALEHAARLYYDEVWNTGSLDLLDELADAGVCFNDALGMEADAFSRSSLKAVIQGFQTSHPLLKYQLDDVMVDEQRNTVVVQYTVTAAHLLPQHDGTEATGHVSEVTGMDKIHFTGSGLISSILSFRQRFIEEEAEPINWDAV